MQRPSNYLPLHRPHAPSIPPCSPRASHSDVSLCWSREGGPIPSPTEYFLSSLPSLHASSCLCWLPSPLLNLFSWRSQPRTTNSAQTTYFLLVMHHKTNKVLKKCNNRVTLSLLLSFLFIFLASLPPLPSFSHFFLPASLFPLSNFSPF